MSSELSQAERTALRNARTSGPGAGDPDAQAESLWIAARDYMEERHVERMAPVVIALGDAKGRERALEKTLDAIAVHDGADWDAEGVCGLAVDALAASPGEPEGQPCPTHNWMGRVEGSTNPCPHCQPDHGPGEPSEHDFVVLCVQSHQLIDPGNYTGLTRCLGEHEGECTFATFTRKPGTTHTATDRLKAQVGESNG